jgi:hypothetical protein
MCLGEQKIFFENFVHVESHFSVKKSIANIQPSGGDPDQPKENRNPAENAQNQLRQVVRKMCHDVEVKWEGRGRRDAPAKIQVLRKYIIRLD